MRYSNVAPLALAALAAAKPMPQAPASSVPESCSTTYPGTFKIQIVNATSDVATKAKRQSQNEDDTLLQLTLNDGVLKDEQDRTGYVASNSQLQFNSPVQGNAIYDSGFAVCNNGSLTIGNDAIWYACLSGTFYNLYDQNDAAQCSPVYINVLGSSSSGVASQSADGQVTATVASQQSDGQVTGSVVSQISDGQIQATTAAAVTQISDGQIQATTATPAAPVTQISDGQIQATSAVAPVTQISDGQIQATSAVAPVTQISDGQIQATSAVAPVTQISDGQIQATSAVSPVTQISDGQIQAPTNGTGYTGPAATSVVAYTGAAMPTAMAGSFAAAVGLVAAAML